METVITKLVHLERTSETDEVPALWAVGQIERQLKAIPEGERASAVLTGWRGARLQYRHERSPLEVAEDRLQILTRGLTSTRDGLTVDQITALLRAAGL